jgi:vitamin B12 transporter
MIASSPRISNLQAIPVSGDAGRLQGAFMKLRPQHALAGSALFQLLTLPVFAQSTTDSTPVAPMDTIVVTAAKVEQKISDTILDTTVITQQDIVDSQATDLPTLLRREAGVEIVQSGGIGSSSSLFLRGTNSTHTLVLIDGVRASGASTGTTAIDQIMLDEVERIEIVRGNVSSVYGSEAIGGVIQIFTKRGHGAPALSATVGGGNRNTDRATATYGGVIGDTRFNVTASTYGTRGFPALNGADSTTTNTNNDGYHNNSLSANIEQSFGPAVHVGISGYYTEGHLAYGDPFAFSINDINTADTRVGYASVFGEYKVNGMWTTKLTLARGEDYSLNYLNYAPNGLFQTFTNQADWENTVLFAPGQKLLLGAELRRQDLNSDTEYDQTARTVKSVFAGYTGEFGDNSVQLNVRNEHYSDFGSATTYLAGYGYRITPSWRVDAAASSAFAAPNYNDLYYPGFSNPNLQPEKAQSEEIGIQYGAGAQLAKLVIFQTRIRDLIEFSSVTFLPVNIGRAEITGAELSYRGQLFGADVIASVTEQDPVDQSSGTDIQLLRRAKQFASLSLQKSFGDWRLGGEWHVSGPRTDDNVTAYPTAVDTLGGYNIVNLTARYQINKSLAIQARGDNVFNKKYVLADGYNTEPATIFVSLSYQTR